MPIEKLSVGFQTQKMFARPCWLVVVGVNAPERAICGPIRIELDPIRSERRKVGVVELIQVDTAGIEIDKSPAVKKAELDIAKLAPIRRKIPLLDKAAANAA